MGYWKFFEPIFAPTDTDCEMERGEAWKAAGGWRSLADLARW